MNRFQKDSKMQSIPASTPNRGGEFKEIHWSADWAVGTGGIWLICRMGCGNWRKLIDLPPGLWELQEIRCRYHRRYRYLCRHRYRYLFLFSQFSMPRITQCVIDIDIVIGFVVVTAIVTLSLLIWGSCSYSRRLSPCARGHVGGAWRAKEIICGKVHGVYTCICRYAYKYIYIYVYICVYIYIYTCILYFMKT